MRDRRVLMWPVWSGVSLAIVVALALMATSATAQTSRPWPDCGPGHFRTGARVTNSLPANIDVGIERSVPADTWVQCRTPVYYVDWFSPVMAHGRPSGFTRAEERGTRCLAERCAVFVDMIVSAAQYRASRDVVGTSYLLDHSDREESCGKVTNRCRVLGFFGTINHGEGDSAVCNGWGGPVRSGDSTGSISVFCSAWMVDATKQGQCYPLATVTKVAHTSVAKTCRRPPAQKVPESQRPDYPGEMPQPTEKPGNPPEPPPPSCPPPDQGGIDLTLMGEFFGNQWAAGEVRASPSDGSASETASVGYDSTSVGHFGPWRCGTTTTLTATPARGNHFDRWVSGEGLCATAVPTCTVPIATTTHDITVLFAPTVYKLSVTNEQPAGVVYSRGGGGFVSPGIDCGSVPNGSTVVMVYTMCSSGAIAQRSDTDVTQLEVDADSRGPGDRTYGIASIDGCDRSVAISNQLPGGGGTYVSSVQCFIDMNNDRTITVSYKDVGPAH